MIVFSLNTTLRSSTTIRHTDTVNTHSETQTKGETVRRTHTHGRPSVPILQTHTQAFAGHYGLTAGFLCRFIESRLNAFTSRPLFTCIVFFLSFFLDLSLCLRLSLSVPLFNFFLSPSFFLFFYIFPFFSICPTPSTLCYCHSLLINLLPPFLSDSLSHITVFLFHSLPFGLSILFCL